MNFQPSFDLQSHSTYSDGQLPPGEVVQAAQAAGVRLLALTDHDSVAGVEEAIQAAHNGTTIVPAVELSAVHAGYEDFHVLGYGIDHRDPVCFWSAPPRPGPIAIAGPTRWPIVCGIWASPWTRRSWRARRATGAVLGRPHLAGAVVSHPDNRERLAEDGLETIERFIPAYLIPGKPAYMPRTRPTVEEAITWIHDARGLAVWAHPFWDVSEDQVVLDAIDRFRSWGLDGVECFYPTFSSEQTRLLAGRCRELGLLSTGSSDFHGPTHKIFSRFLAFELHGEEPELGPIGEG